MTSRTLLNHGWTFVSGFNEAWTRSAAPGQNITLPHNAHDLPWNYGDERAYQRAFTYQRQLPWHPGFEDREVLLHFEGTMADARVFLNGTLLGHYRDGYTPFQARLTRHLIIGDNLITVCLDGTENGDIPPFGGRIDYLTYAGIYRDVWLDVRPALAIGALKIEIDDPLGAAPVPRVRISLANPQGLEPSGTLTLHLNDPDGELVEQREVAAADGEIVLKPITKPQLWSLDQPSLYTLHLAHSAGHAISCRFGIRTASFTAQGFFLNGRPLKIIGLNRHQSAPHIGYALGPEAQARDADILKFELGLNLVRTSHYPQSTAFLDRCDEIGLLVFEEIPGWQHIGGQAFKEQSLKNVEAMIRRDWNHPSIILWGVRINESPDDDAFYAATNALARTLDPTRQTGGVRCIPNSTLLEDVYTMNDFVLGEEHLPEHQKSRSNRPRTALRDQREVTGLARDVPYLVTEYNGHMYPTKIFDGEERQSEHVLRHLEVLNAAHGDPSIAGSIGWCMADYNTHADFGSGDRICYHGVMTMTRAPKFAAAVYASQGLSPRLHPVLEPATHWSFGDRKVGGVFPLIILTNCDEISFQYGQDEPLRFKPAFGRFPHLPHPPVIIEATDLPPEKLTVWGQSWKDGLIIGFLEGRQIARRQFVGNPLPTSLAMQCGSLLRPRDSYHDRLVRITACDQAGNRLPFLMDQLALEIEGPASIRGPATIPLIGGVAGCWVRVSGDEPVRLTARPASGILPPQSLVLDGLTLEG